jgi:hypothetical protein
MRLQSDPVCGNARLSGAVNQRRADTETDGENQDLAKDPNAH